MGNMDPRLVWCLALVSIVHSVHSDDSEWSGNDIGRSLAETPAGRYAGEGIEHGRRGDDGRDKTGDEENEVSDNISAQEVDDFQVSKCLFGLRFLVLVVKSWRFFKPVERGTYK